MNEAKTNTKNMQKQNHKAMICAIILVMMSVLIYACFNVLLPYLNGGANHLKPEPSPFTGVSYPKDEEEAPISTEELVLAQDEAIAISPEEQLAYEPQDYTIMNTEGWSEEALNAYRELIQDAEPRYVISNVTVRAEQLANSEVLGTLKDGDKVLLKAVGKSYDTIIYQGKLAYVKTNFLSSKLLENHGIEFTIRKLDPDAPMVALTFDDGPNPIATPRILDTLEQYDAVATFFDLGSLVERFPDVVRREEAIGCDVGCHSYGHANLVKLSAEEIQEDVAKAEAAFEKVLGHKPFLYRPPYGNINITVKEVLEYPLITWNVDSLDWKLKNKTKNLAQIRKTKNYDGHIILMHSIYNTTADTVEILVPELIQQGYQLVTIPELYYYKMGITLRTRSVYSGI